MAYLHNKEVYTNIEPVDIVVSKTRQFLPIIKVKAS